MESKVTSNTDTVKSVTRRYRSNEEKFNIVLKYIETSDRKLTAEIFGVTPNMVSDYFAIFMEKGPSLFERKKYLNPVISNYDLAKELNELSVDNESLKAKIRFYKEGIKSGEIVIKGGG